MHYLCNALKWQALDVDLLRALATSPAGYCKEKFILAYNTK